MRIVDNCFWKFLLSSIICGVISSLLSAFLWDLISGVNLFYVDGAYLLLLAIALIWTIGSLIAWVTSKSTKSLPVKSYFWFFCIILLCTLCLEDAMMFLLAFFIVQASLPAIPLMYIINNKILKLSEKPEV